MQIEAILSNRIQLLKTYLSDHKITAYRLYHQGCGPWNISIDIYGKDAIIHQFEPIDLLTRIELEGFLKKTLQIERIFYKDRTGKGAGSALGKQNHCEAVIDEYGHSFLLNLSDYLDVGLFLDHRETRHFIESQSKGKTVLNTFAYTGSFSIYAAAGGAEKTYSVDLSKTYCEWIKKNLELNKLSPEKNWVYKMDTLEFLDYAKRKELRFDIIIIDPPTFSKNKGEHFSVEKDYPRLLNGALPLLNSGGFIVFSNNCKDFKLDLKKVPLCTIEKTSQWIPPDFEGSEPHHCYVIRNR